MNIIREGASDDDAEIEKKEKSHHTECVQRKGTGMDFDSSGNRHTTICISVCFKIHSVDEKQELKQRFNYKCKAAQQFQVKGNLLKKEQQQQKNYL